jgi:hypothetical protein
MESSDTSRGFILRAFGTFTVSNWGVQFPSVTGNIAFSSGSILTNNVWNHIAITYTGNPTGTLIYYQNGSQIKSVTASSSYIAPLTASGDEIHVFNGPSAANIVADVAMWNIVLTQVEITGLAQGQRPPTIRPASLQVYQRLDGLVLPDPGINGMVLTQTAGSSHAVAGPPYAPLSPPWPQFSVGPFLPPQAPWGSRRFNGTSDQINCGTSIAPAAITLSIWFNASTLTPAYQTLFGRDRQAVTNSFWQIHIKSTGHLAYYVRGGVGSINIDPGTGAVSTGAWHHVALTYDSTNGLKGYLDGVADGTAAANGALNSTFVSEQLQIGNDTAVAGRFFGGQLADAAIWNVSLSALEIAALAKGARPPVIREPSLIAYYPIDGLQSPEEDLSGFKNNGTVTGTTPAAGPPYAMLSPRWPQFPAVVAAPTFNPAWAKPLNQVISGGRAT